MLQKCSLGSPLSAAHELSALPQDFMMVGCSKAGRGWSVLIQLVIRATSKTSLNSEVTKAQYESTCDPAVGLTNIHQWKENGIIGNDRIGEFFVMQNRFPSGNSLDTCNPMLPAKPPIDHFAGFLRKA
jgi:hypothetical protein